MWAYGNRLSSGGQKLNYRNRLHLLVIGMSHAVIDIYGGMLPALVPVIQDRLLLSYSAAGALLAWSNLTSSLVQPALGLVSDMTGGVRLVTGGLILTSLAIAVIGYVTSYQILIVVAIMAGLGIAIYHPQSASIMAHLSREQRGSAMALYGVAGNIGFALGPSVLALLLAFGDLSLLWVVALPGVLIGLAIRIMSLRSDAFEKPIDSHVSSPVNAYEAHHNELVDARNMWLAEMLLLGVVTLRSFVQYGVVTFLPQYMAQVLGGPGNISPRLQSLFLAAGAFGTLAGGACSDRFGKRSFILASFMCLVPIHWALYRVRSALIFAVLLVVEGFVLMSTFSAGLVMSQDLLPRFTGLASGLYLGACVGMGGLGATVVGVVADAKGLSFAFGSLVLCPIIGLGLTLLLPGDRASDIADMRDTISR